MVSSKDTQTVPPEVRIAAAQVILAEEESVEVSEVLLNQREATLALVQKLAAAAGIQLTFSKSKSSQPIVLRYGDELNEITVPVPGKVGDTARIDFNEAGCEPQGLPVMIIPRAAATADTADIGGGPGLQGPFAGKVNVGDRHIDKQGWELPSQPEMAGILKGKAGLTIQVTKSKPSLTLEIAVEPTVTTKTLDHQGDAAPYGGPATGRFYGVTLPIQFRIGGTF